MKVREHRGSLDDSMATVREVKDRAELLGIIQEQLKPFEVSVTHEQIHVEPYCRDERTGWDTWLITIDGYGVWGMADGPIGHES